MDQDDFLLPFPLLFPLSQASDTQISCKEKGKAYGVGGCILLQKEEVPTAPRPMQYFVPQWT